MKKLCSLSLCLAISSLKPVAATPALPSAPPKLPLATQKQIEALLRHPGLRDGHVGIAIVALGRAASPLGFPAQPYAGGAQPLLFARDAAKRFTPASNFKLFTAAWVLHQLGPQKTFVTRAVQNQILAIRAGSWPTGTPYPRVVTLYGDGDPSLQSSDLETLARDAAAQSVGTAVVVRASDALFPRGAMNAEEGGGRYPDGWTLDDAIWYYGAPVAALSLNRNQVDVFVTGGVAGEPAQVSTSPEAPFSIFPTVTTVAADDPRAGQVIYTRGDATSPLSSTLKISGFIGAGKTDTQGIAVPDPRGWAESIFDAAMRQSGAQVVEPDGIYGLKDPAIIAQHESAPLSQILQRFLKNSDNLYGEMLLRRAAASLPRPISRRPTPAPTATAPTATAPTATAPTATAPTATAPTATAPTATAPTATAPTATAPTATAPTATAPTATAPTATTPAALLLPPAEPQSPQIASSGLAAQAHTAMLKWLKQSGVPTAGLRFSDGSGLSRYDLATPISIARLLSAVDKMPGGEAIYTALPVAGVDGTLKNRMNGTAAQGNARAKTGTFAIANCLSGYVTTRDGQRLAVSIMTNFVEDGELARRWEGQLFATLAAADLRKK